MSDAPPPAPLPEDATPSPAVARGSALGSSIAWTVILLAIALALTARHLRQADPAAQQAQARESGDVAAEMSVTLLGRYAVGVKTLLGSIAVGSSQNEQMAQLADQVERAAVSPVTRIRSATVLAELEGTERAQRLLESGEALAPELREDVVDLDTIYRAGPDALDGDRQSRLVERHGWFGQLALSWGRPDDDPQRRRALAPAKRTAVVSFAALVGGIVVAVAAIILFVIGIVLASRGRLRRGYEAAGAPAAGVFVEAFAVYLGWFILIGLVGRGLGAQGSMRWFWTGVAGAAPLACLWPLVRGVRFAELRLGLGWHRGRGWLREAGAGLAGYVAGLPVMLVGFFITMALARLLGTQPAHPIIKDISGTLRNTLAILALASIYAPLAEETMFRGALYHGLRGRAPFVLSALVVAFIFAVIHPQGLAAVPALMGIALVLAALREWRGSIVAPVVAHAINNGIILILLVLTVA